MAKRNCKECKWNKECSYKELKLKCPEGRFIQDISSKTK